MAEVESMLRLKANKKLMASHLHQVTGKRVILKDIHNVAVHQQKENNLQSLVDEMCKTEGQFTLLVDLSDEKI